MSTLKQKAEEILTEKNEKIIPSNIKSGVQIFDVVGTMTQSGVKLFDTIEHMQEDSTAQAEDKALVYRESMSSVTSDSEFDSCMFPSEVILDSEFGEEIYFSFRAVDSSSSYFDGWGELSSSMFWFSGYSDQKEIRVQYSSEDGITYTRTDGGDEIQEFGTLVKYEPYEVWNDVISKFMKIKSTIFEGVFKYSDTYKDDTKIQIISLDDIDISFNGSSVSVDWNGNYMPTLYNKSKIIEFINLIAEDCGVSPYSYSYSSFVLDKDGVPCLVIDSGKVGSVFEIGDYFIGSLGIGVYDIGGNWLGTPNRTGLSSSTNNGTISKVFKLNFESMTYTSTEYTGTAYPYSNGDYCSYIEFEISTVPIRISSEGEFINNYHYVVYTGNSRNSYYRNEGFSIKAEEYPVIPQYIPLTTQLNAISDYVYEKTFYGKNGVETGTLKNGVMTSVNKPVFIKLAEIINNTGIIMTNGITFGNDFGDISEIPFKLNRTNVTNMRSMFSECHKLEEIPLIDTSKVTTMEYMFYNCMEMKELPLIDTSNVTNMMSMFSGCKSLTTVPLLNTSNVTNMSNMFVGCASLTAVPQLDTSNTTDMSFMFFDCTSLENVPILDTSKAINLNQMFLTAPKLTDESLNNIMQMCINAVSYTGTKTLKTLGLANTTANRCTTLSNYQDFINAGWTTGY